ncbi:MAG: MATE family efflux transporter [Lachnospiraceae bacterium]|nr:MATE family efflux transporter [Lachnospiraceae bacterium]
MFTNKALLLLVLPIIAEQLLTSLMGMADSMMVANVSDAALSAVSLVDSVNMLIIQAFNALATGGVIICSNYIGQKNITKANEAARQLVLVATAISVSIMLICILFHRPLLRLIFGSIEDDVMNAAIIYFMITIISYPAIALSGAGSAIYRAQGNTRLPMNVAITSNVLNIAGNAFLIYVMHLGVFGAALATTLSRFFYAVTLMIMLHRKDQMLSVRDYLKIRPSKANIRAILAMGIPNGIENSMFQFGKLAIQSSVALCGTMAITAQAMTVIFENVNGVGGVGVGLALMTVVGQCLGAGRKDEVIYYMKKFVRWSYVVILISCLFAYAIARPVTALSGMNAESARLCVYMTGWITIVKPIIWPLSFTTAYGLRASGDVKFSMVVSSLTMWLCRVSLSTFLIRVCGMGPIGVWIGMFSDWTLRAIIFSIRFHSRKFLNHKIVES